MTEFTLDTSGEVRTRWDMAIQWHQLSPFEQGYTRKGLEDLIARIQSGQIAPLDGVRRWPGFSDLAPETLAAIRKDCAANDVPGRFAGTAVAGAYFWKLRNGSPGLRGFPPLTVTLGDDGKVYAR